MGIDNEKLNLYRDHIPSRKGEEAFRYFYVTKDPKIRENLFNYYLNSARNYFNRYNIEYMEEEDKEQYIAEILLDTIDKFNPFANNSYFSIFLRRHINSILLNSSPIRYRNSIYNTLKKYNIDSISEENIDFIINESLNSIGEEKSIENIVLVKSLLGYNDNYSFHKTEIKSKDNLEDNIISKMDRERIIKVIKEYAPKFKSVRAIEAFNAVYDLDNYTTKTQRDAAGELNLSVQRIQQLMSTMKRFLYLSLAKETLDRKDPSYDRNLYLSSLYPLYDNDYLNLLFNEEEYDSYDSLYSLCGGERTGEVRIPSRQISNDLGDELVVDESVSEDSIEEEAKEEKVKEEQVLEEQVLEEQVLEEPSEPVVKPKRKYVRHDKERELREQIFFTYMSYAREIYNEFNTEDIEEDEKNQRAYELLLNAIDSCEASTYDDFKEYIKSYFLIVMGKNEENNLYIKYGLEDTTNDKIIGNIIRRLGGRYTPGNAERIKNIIGVNNAYTLDDVIVQDSLDMEDYVINNICKDELFEIVNNIVEKFELYKKYYELGDHIPNKAAYLGRILIMHPDDISKKLKATEDYLIRILLARYSIEEIIESLEAASSNEDNSYKYELK